MLKNLVDFRDFCYVRLAKHEGEQSAKWWYKIQLMGFFVLYYIAFLMLVAIFMNRTGTVPAFIYSENPFMALFTIPLFFGPYILFSLYLFRKMAVYPINKQIPAEKYKKLNKKLYIHLLVGVVLSFLVPWGSNKLIPPIVNPVMHESSGK